MLEIEMKFRVDGFSAIETKLASLSVSGEPAIFESDHYFNAPDRDFAKTDEALRLRRIGSSNKVTYKGPKRDLQTKTRTEIEVDVADGEQAAHKFMQILQLLGYRRSGVVRKSRTIYKLQRDSFPTEICLDDVAGLGKFVELETVASENQLEAGRAMIFQLASELELSLSERRSYLEMTLAKQAVGK